MPWRIYTANQKQYRRDGTYSITKIKHKRWLKSRKQYKPQKRGLEKKSIYSKRFGFLDLYNRKEQQNLICPSGYSLSQCFHVLSLMWAGYHKARTGIQDGDKSYERMVKYAKAIQGVQEDMGIPTTSFPHIGLYGDQLILNNKKGERIAFEDHSALKEKQQEYEKWQKEQAENAKKIQEKLQKPDKEKGEEIEEFADDVGPSLMEDDEETVPELLEPESEKGEEIVTFTDEVPFKRTLQEADE